MKKSLTMILLFCLANGIASAQTKITKTADNGVDDIAFGFANNTGKGILLLNNDNINNPSKFTFAISDKGVLSPVIYIKTIKATTADNGRQNYQNFDNSGGYLFRVKSGIVDSNSAVVLLSPEFVSSRKMIKLKSIEKEELPDPFKWKIETAKGRKIKNYKELAVTSKGESIYLIEFEAKADSVLASLVFITPDEIIYKDYPAIYDSSSTWHVDDGGELGMYYNILAIFEHKGVIEIVTEWFSAEGTSIEFMEESGKTFNPIEFMKEPGKTFKTIKSDYRYLAPL